MFSNDDIVPVVMFHSVGLEKSDCYYSHLSESLMIFEEKINALVSSGYQFIFWQDLYDHMSGSRVAPEKSIMLTFDDGYLDNWVYVFPIIKKYGAKATIFVNPDFVDPNNCIRPNLEDVWSGKVGKDEIQPLGFLNWEEIRLMEKSGLVDIQSHALSHTWYFSGPKLLDFYKPGDKQYRWLAWNMRPEQKPFYMLKDQSNFVPWGTPVYEYEKALICRRYFPPQEVAEKITALVRQNGDEDFFQQRDWKKDLQQYHDKLMKEYKAKERYESSKDYDNRIFEELFNSKKEIEKHLSKKVDFVCWPGGAYNKTVLSIATQIGYKAWTLSSRDQSNFRNSFGAGPNQIKRIGSFHRYRGFKGEKIGNAVANYFLSAVKRHKGSYIHEWIWQFIRIYGVLKSILFSKK